LNPYKRAKSAEVGGGQRDLRSPTTRDLVRPATNGARDHLVINSEASVTGLTDGELQELVELAVSAKRWALVTRLSAELARRDAGVEEGKVVAIDRGRIRR